ncbi:MAG: hypothetical protein IPG87_03670 [Saprospiraceae bacterium]|nr:hypothetical protein [Candidatus Vicinibacter affinis]
MTENTVVLDSFLTRSINGLYNSADTIKLNLISESSLSKIKVTLENLTKSSQYIFQILDKEKVLAERIFVAGNENEIINFKSVDPGKYNARLILDSNNNQEWDPVNYINKTYPEKIWNWPLEELRPDWEIEVTFNIK